MLDIVTLLEKGFLNRLKRLRSISSEQLIEASFLLRFLFLLSFKRPWAHLDGTSQVNMGNMLAEGRGVPKDLEKAKYYYRMAAPFNNHAKWTLEALEREERGEDELSSLDTNNQPQPQQVTNQKKEGCVIL